MSRDSHRWSSDKAINILFGWSAHNSYHFLYNVILFCSFSADIEKKEKKKGVSTDESASSFLRGSARILKR